MNKTKIRFLTILALFSAFALAFGFAVGALFHTKSALAVEYRPTEIFSAGTDGSVGASEGEGDQYVQFTFSKEKGSVHFRRDLALKWFAPLVPETEEGGEGEEGENGNDPAAQAEEPAATYQTGRYSMTFAFPTFDFTRFTLTYEGAEENVTKEGVSTNSLVFFYEDSTLKVAVRDSYHQPEEDVKEEEDTWFEETEKTALTVAAGGDITLSLTDEGVGYGEFKVLLNGEEAGVFTNIGGYFLEYLSSASSTPRDPITFTADKLAEGKTEQKLLMKELNGQSFTLNSDGRVTDNADPVLIVNEEVYAYTLGRKWSLTYEAVDVCDSSVTVTRRYAMVNAADEDGLYPKPLSGDYSALTTSTVFMPTSDTQEEEQYVSIYFELDDGTNLSGLTSGQKAEKWIYLAWYAADGQTKTLHSAKAYKCPKCGELVSEKEYEDLDSEWKCPNTEGTEDHGDVTKEQLELTEVDDFTYIIVNRGDIGAAQTGEKSGPTYVGVTADEATKTNVKAEEADTLAEEYQRAIDEIAYKKDKDGNLTRELALSAGDGSYFYLPSLRSLITSKNADYRNLRFSVYYKKQSLETSGSASSATSLRYNALRFEIDEEGKYIFKVLASDAAGNTMKYYDADGRLADVSSGNIWDIEEIPTFRFETGYTGAKVEDPGTQTPGYRESTYTVPSFDIVALSDYKATYTLYRFDEGALGGLSKPEYNDFVENVKDYVETYAACLKEVKTFNSSVSEEDEDQWERTDNKYHWDPDSSLSFVPQEATYYIVKLTIEEERLPGHTATAYQVIDVKNPLDPIPNTTEWLENNVTSVVLFSVSAVLLIVIIILFVVKPSDKNIEEVDVKTLRGKKQKGNKDKEE